MAKYTEKQNKWTQDYIKKAYDTIVIRVPKGKRLEYNELAGKQGKSLTKLIMELLEEQLEKRDTF